MTIKLLVIGRSGQLATALTELGAEPFEVVAVGRDRVDLRSPEAISPILDQVRPALVVNAAAYTAVDRAETETRLAFAINATAPGVLAARAAERDIPFLHVSTDYVFDGAEDGPWVEDDPVGPLGAYGASKLAGELLVAARHPDAVILRTSWVFAAAGSNFVRTMLRLAQTRPELRVVSDQRGRPTSAATLANAIFAAAPSIIDGKGTGNVYHLSNGGPETSWHGFAEAILAELPARNRPTVVPIATAEYPTPARRPANSVLALDKFSRTFGYEPPDWRAALGDVVSQIGASAEA